MTSYEKAMRKLADRNVVVCIPGHNDDGSPAVATCSFSLNPIVARTALDPSEHMRTYFLVGVAVEARRRLRKADFTPTKGKSQWH